MRQAQRLLLSVTVAALVAGCSGYEGPRQGLVTGKHFDEGYTTLITMPCGKSTCLVPEYIPPAYYLHIKGAKSEGEMPVDVSEYNDYKINHCYPHSFEGRC